MRARAWQAGQAGRVGQVGRVGHRGHRGQAAALALLVGAFVASAQAPNPNAPANFIALQAPVIALEPKPAGALELVLRKEV